MKKNLLVFFILTIIVSCKKDINYNDDLLIGSTWTTERHAIFQSCDHLLKSEDFLEENAFPCHPENTYTFTSDKNIKAETQLLHYGFLNGQFTCLTDGKEKKQLTYKIINNDIFISGDNLEKKGFFLSKDSIVFSNCEIVNITPSTESKVLVVELLIRKK